MLFFRHDFRYYFDYLYFRCFFTLLCFDAASFSLLLFRFSHYLLRHADDVDFFLRLRLRHADVFRLCYAYYAHHQLMLRAIF